MHSWLLSIAIEADLNMRVAWEMPIMVHKTWQKVMVGSLPTFGTDTSNIGITVLC